MEWRVPEVRMGRAQVSCELVPRVAPDEDADRHIEDAVLGVELLDAGATAGGDAEDLLKVAVQDSWILSDMDISGFRRAHTILALAQVSIRTDDSHRCRNVDGEAA
jgi:hypothetical protein